MVQRLQHVPCLVGLVCHSLLGELACRDWQANECPDHRRARLRRRETRSVLLFTRFQRPQEPLLHLPHSRLQIRSQIPKTPIVPHSSPPIESGYCTRVALQPDGGTDCQTPQFVKYTDGHHHRCIRRVCG